MAQNFDREILANGHLEKFDEKNLTNSIMLMLRLMPAFING